MRVDVACVSRGTAQDNEDFAAVALPGAVGALVVLDGVGGAGAGCRHGVPWFTARLGTRLLELASTRPRFTLADCLAAAIDRTAAAHRTTCDLSQIQTPQSTVVTARWHDGRLDYLVLSDSTLLLRNPDGAVTPVVDRSLDRMPPETHARLRHLREAVERSAPGSPEHTVASREHQRFSEALRNADGGFFTAAADPSVAARSVTGTERLADVAALAALTDGATSWVDTFGAGTWADCLDLLGKEGPHGLISRVRTAERGDPDRTSFRRDKPIDDAAVVFVEF